jgi:large subunit ribosomal protein L20
MRVKRGVAAHKRHNKIRKATKGFTKSNRSSVKRGKQAVTRSLQFAYRDRRNKKRTFRHLWNARINPADRRHEIGRHRRKSQSPK